MAVENDLTPEEQAMFAAGGGDPAPVVETPAPVVVSEPARDDAGRFAAPAAPVAAPVAEVPAPAAAVETPAAPTMVPHAALHAERVRANEAIRQSSLATARMNAMLSRQQETRTQVELPDLNVDPEGYMRGLEQRIQQFETERREETQQRQVDTALELDEQQFQSYTPDYQQASEHYVRSRAQELLLSYTPEEAQQIMRGEVRQIAQQSWQKGQPAAAGIYALAKARGYTPGIPAPPVTPAVTPPAPAPAAAVVAAVNTGQAASRTLSGGTGAPAAAVLNAEALLNMSDEEFEAYLKLGDKGANGRFAAIGGA